MAEPELELEVAQIRKKQMGQQQEEQLVEQVVPHHTDLQVAQEQALELHRQQTDPMLVERQPEGLVEHPSTAYWPCFPSYLVELVADHPYRSWLEVEHRTLVVVP